MKLLIAILFGTLVSLSLADDFEPIEVLLEVPADPNSWNFKGKDSKYGRESRISDGERATNTQFPWVAELAINTASSGILCTASLISDYWLLGSQRCLAGIIPVSVRGALGSADRVSNRLYIFFYKYITVHSGSNPPDIALYKITQKVYFTEYIYPIRLPALSHSLMTYENQIITIVGWGNIAGDGFTRFLQWAQFKVMSPSLWNDEIYMCSLPVNEKSLAGYGDSGGSAVIYENGVPTLIGINVIHKTDVKYLESTRVNLFVTFISALTGIPLRN